jgi:peptidoglycan-associated lipoprotein
MKRSARFSQTFVGLLVVLGMMAWVAGCGGGDQEVETDAAAAAEEATEAVETVPEPMAPEEPADGQGIAQEPVRDYSAMAPAEYGVEDVFFDFDEYDLDSEAMATLARNATIIKQHPQVTILVEGHCDERGTVQYNLALGEKRAKAVRDYLVSLGVASKRLRVTSYGESRPFALGSNEQAWAQNRRAHFARP